MSIWNDWRARYDTMTWSDQMDFHAGMVNTEQTHFTRHEILKFACGLPKGSKIVEIGGWKGEMADYVLRVCPNIGEWLNIEVLRAALGQQRDPRYWVMIPDDFIWAVGLPEGYDVLLMSHTLEHMRGGELAQIIQQFHGTYAYLEAPLDDPQRANGWHDYPGTHITELDWPALDKLMASQDFTKGRDLPGDSHDTRIGIYVRHPTESVEDSSRS